MWQYRHFPCATFFPLHNRAVSPTQGTEHSFRGVMFPSHDSCCAFPLSLSIFNSPFTSKRSQAPQCPGPRRCIRVDTNQKTRSQSERNALVSVSPAGHVQAMLRAGKRCSAGKLFSVQHHCYNRLLYYKNLEKERENK